MKKVSKELVDFFQQNKQWEKDELLAAYVAEIQLQMGFETIVPDDEIRLMWGHHKALSGTLQDFSSALYDKIMEGVCNVIKTA